MKTESIIASVILLTASACAGTPIDWDEARTLKNGMTEAQVLERLGYPYQVATKPDGSEVWVWVFTDPTMSTEVLSIIMHGGKIETMPRILD